MKVLDVQELTRRFHKFTAVENLSFSCEAGEILGLVGPNGSGKTTTLRCMSGILEPSHGLVRIQGHRLDEEPVAAKQNLAFVPDDPSLFEYLTVEEHLAFFARVYDVPDAGARAEELLDQFVLAEKRKKLPQELSRGMRQKLAVACGLIHSPAILMLDEPLTGLDPAAMRRLKDRLLDMASRGTCIVLSSHLLQLVEELAGRVLILQDGLCRALGSLTEIRAAARLGEDADLEDAFLQVTRDRPLTLPPES